MNKTSAKEWLVIAFHDLQSAKFCMKQTIIQIV